MTTAHAGAAPRGALLAADLDEVKRVLEGIGTRRARVWLFGSRATGSAGRGSDIDVPTVAGRRRVFP